MFAKASTFVGSGRPHTFVKCPSASATRKLRRRGGCRKRFPVDLPRVAAPDCLCQLACAPLHAWWPRGRNAKDYVNTFIPIRGRSSATLRRGSRCGKLAVRRNFYLPIQRVAVHCGREYGGQHFPTSHRRTRRHSGPIATVRVIRQRAPILP
jgi:hypothetical protein